MSATVSESRLRRRNPQAPQAISMICERFSTTLAWPDAADCGGFAAWSLVQCMACRSRPTALLFITTEDCDAVVASGGCGTFQWCCMTRHSADNDAMFHMDRNNYIRRMAQDNIAFPTVVHGRPYGDYTKEQCKNDANHTI